jgi:hypothetical protein
MASCGKDDRDRAVSEPGGSGEPESAQGDGSSEMEVEEDAQSGSSGEKVFGSSGQEGSGDFSLMPVADRISFLVFFLVRVHSISHVHFSSFIFLSALFIILLVIRAAYLLQCLFYT